MIDDVALSLKKAYEKGENITQKEAQKMLEQLHLGVFYIVVRTTWCNQKTIELRNCIFSNILCKYPK